MSQPNDLTRDTAAGDAAVRISSEVMVTAIVFLFMVIVFVFLLYLYARRNLRHPGGLRRSRHRLVFAAADFEPTARRGLDASVLRSLPVTVYRAEDFEEGIECAVCLCEISDGEQARLLPKCGHGFHLGCIDMWFESHSTCPLCRSPITAAPSKNPNPAVEPREAPPPDFAPELANQAEGASSSSGRPIKTVGALMIDIPRGEPERFHPPISPLSSNRAAAEEMRSPVSARFSSLRRRWSMGRRTPGSASSPTSTGGDIEQGLAGYGEGSPLPAKSPTNS